MLLDREPDFFMSIFDEPVNPNLAMLEPTKKQLRSIKLLMQLDDRFDEAHAYEFVQIFAYEISNSEGGVQGLLKKLQEI